MPHGSGSVVATQPQHCSVAWMLAARAVAWAVLLLVHRSWMLSLMAVEHEPRSLYQFCAQLASLPFGGTARSEVVV